MEKSIIQVEYGGKNGKQTDYWTCPFVQKKEDPVSVLHSNWGKINV